MNVGWLITITRVKKEAIRSNSRYCWYMASWYRRIISSGFQKRPNADGDEPDSCDIIQSLCADVLEYRRAGSDADGGCRNQCQCRSDENGQLAGVFVRGK